MSSVLDRLCALSVFFNSAKDLIFESKIISSGTRDTLSFISFDSLNESIS